VCGIAGRLNFKSQRPVEGAAVHAMCDMLAHRGPDGSGVWVDGPIGLGHRRLAIIDLSDAGRQPMTTADGRFTITFNGEIYNFLELRARLEGLGHVFRTASDTEAILHAYRQYGPECVTYLRGMFAFALWDRDERTLFVARDRVGKKPLHYRVDDDGIAFASEPKAFLAEESFRPEADPHALLHYLTLQYVPAPRSAFRGVRKLPPAHSLLVRNGRVEEHRYWQLRYQPKRRWTDEEAIAALREKLEEAVRLRLISDVPLGAFLSGGIDSGTIVALMSKVSGARVKTFSIGFEEQEFNELPYARQVAERYGTEHHEFIVRPSALEILPKLVWHYNEPFADSSAIPCFYLSELTRRHVTVALNGDAGDENFAGYDRYLGNVLATRYERFTPGAMHGVFNAAGGILRRGARFGTFRNRLGRFTEALGEGAENRYLRWLVHFHPGTHAQLMTPEFQAAVAGEDPCAPIVETFRHSTGSDVVERMLDTDVNHYLPHDLLVKVDIATMAYSLEGRSPFLDHELMELAASMPSSLKLRGSTKKWLLRRVAADLLPQSLLERPKQGFGVPLERWFRQELREFASDLLLGARFRQRGVIQPAFVKQLLDDHVSGRRAGHYLIWNLLMLESWYQTFIDETRPAPSRETAHVLAGAAR
jgi:asparagine synthase (glutamine-hydrolysing)